MSQYDTSLEGKTFNKMGGIGIPGVLVHIMSCKILSVNIKPMIVIYGVGAIFYHYIYHGDLKW